MKRQEDCKYADVNVHRNISLTVCLLAWYSENKRDLPWRKTKDPYAIWICEVMAQQTRITALLPYYERFMTFFPTVYDLGKAPVDQVLKAWEGLGYYSRAHNLHKAAQLIVEVYEGKLPADAKLLRKLPGIGEYTAGAIMSISFGQPIPAIDGNVFRVFSRLENNGMNISLPATKAALSDHLKFLFPKDNVPEFTQSIMELGALICLPKKPLCEKCPVVSLCKAHQARAEKDLPVKAEKRPLKNVNKTVLLMVNLKGEALMRQRDEKLLHGLWEFYCVDERMSEVQVKKYLNKIGVHTTYISEAGTATHTFTHLFWDMEGFLCLVSEETEVSGYKFFPIRELNKIAIGTAYSFFLRWLLNCYGGFL